MRYHSAAAVIGDCWLTTIIFPSSFSSAME
jgi:hypothetical protein